MTRPGKLYRGDAFWVSFGGYGTQLAVVYEIRDGKVAVQKYRRTSHRWTAPLVVRPGDVATHAPRNARRILAAAGVPPGNLVKQSNARLLVRIIARQGAA